MKKLQLITGTFLLLTIIVNAQKYEMKQAPLMTPWADNVDAKNVLPEYPRPIMERTNWLNLNGVWEFQVAALGDAIPFDTKLKREILVPFPWESAISGIKEQFDSRRAWYRRTFTIPKDWNEKEVLLNFGACDWEAVVYVNKRCVGIHKGGYDAFSLKIGDCLTAKGNNEIIVGVYDPGNDEKIAFGKQNNARFSDPQKYAYSPASGIWQTVWLEPVNKKGHINDLHIIPDVDNQLVKVTIEPNNHKAKGELLVTILDNGTVVAQDTTQFLSEIFLKIDNPKLWSPDSPFLYDVEIALFDNQGNEIDKVKSYVGMRKIEIKLEPEGLQRIYLNNEFLFAMGTLDQGYWPDGIYTAPTDEALKWDIEMTKEFGYNLIRKHIKVEPQRWYYWCDKLGILVYQDMPSTFGKRTEEEETQFETELQRMVKTHWNHPSIVNWVVFNEHWGIYDAVRITQNIVDLDPYRLVTGNSGIDAGKPNIDFEVGHIKDNHSYRPPNVPFATQKRASVCGEYGAIGYKIEDHIWDKDGPWVHHNYDDLEAATTEYEKFIEQILKFRGDGLSAAVYTQWTDVENEMNGIYTYDRKVIKLDKDRINKANKSTYETSFELLKKGN